MRRHDEGPRQYGRQRAAVRCLSLSAVKEGSYRVEAPRQVVKVEEQSAPTATHRAVPSMWDEYQSEWIRLAGEWSGPAYLRHECHKVLWDRAERTAKGEATWEDLQG